MVALKLGLIVAVPVVADAATGVNWFQVLLTLASPVAIVAFFKLRPENRQTEATTQATDVNRQQVLDEMQASVLKNVRGEIASMQQRLDTAVAERATARAELAEVRRDGAEKDLRIEILETAIVHLHDEIAALRAQLGLGGRREDDDPKVGDQ